VRPEAPVVTRGPFRGSRAGERLGGRVGRVELGWDVVDGPTVWRTPGPLTADQRDALGDLQFEGGGDDAYVEPDPRGVEPGGGVFLRYDWPTFEPTQFQAAAVVLAGALLLTLLVVAIGLSLAAT